MGSHELLGFNQSESLSGIETKLLGVTRWMAEVSTNLNPYQGLKQRTTRLVLSILGFVSTNLNPYQGLKLGLQFEL